MSDPIAALKKLRRPRILMSAARCGLVDYNRDRCLRRLIKSDVTPSPVRALDELVRQEAHVDQTRRDGDASYSIARHVELLIAVLGEARLAARVAP